MIDCQMLPRDELCRTEQLGVNCVLSTTTLNDFYVMSRINEPPGGPGGRTAPTPRAPACVSTGRRENVHPCRTAPYGRRWRDRQCLAYPSRNPYFLVASRQRSHADIADAACLSTFPLRSGHLSAKARALEHTAARARGDGR